MGLGGRQPTPFFNGARLALEGDEFLEGWTIVDTSSLPLRVSGGTVTHSPNGGAATRTVGSVTWSYAYNEVALLKEVRKDDVARATYAYDGLGRRVNATEDGVTTFFVYGLGLDPLWTKSGTTETRHVYANGLRIARIVVGGSTYYYHVDALGSTWRRQPPEGVYDVRHRAHRHIGPDL